MNRKTPFWRYRSQVDGQSWPAFLSPRGAAVMATLRQLDESQWWSPEELRAHQNRQLAPLLEHAFRTVPYYGKRWKKVPNPASEDWLQVPLLTRRELQAAGRDLISRDMPKRHGKSRLIRTSGSTGMPVETLTNAVIRHHWDVITMRDHVWHQRDLQAKLAIVRFLDRRRAMLPEMKDIDGWGCIAGELCETGPTRLINILNPIEGIVRWVAEERPNYLMLYPSLLDEMLRDHGALFDQLDSLCEIRTLSEVVTPESRAKCREVTSARLVDIYTTIEIGYIALQCPDRDHYHIQSENVLVEILDDDGRPCMPGETGRVVVTCLHNYATPLIRYELGDLAVAGEECTCGRGLPVIERILGRYRNLMCLPNGKRRYPEFGYGKNWLVAPIRQVQMVQTGPEDITVKMVLDHELDEHKKRELTTVLRETLDYPFSLRFERVESLRRSENGKYEEFISLV